MVKVELEFESKNSDIKSVFNSLSEIISEAQEKGLNLKELEVEAEEEEEDKHPC